MPLAPRTRLGSYEIAAPLGAGGMGEDYRARDTKLGRDVALKVLPEELAADTERMARFEREAKVLTSLNHPNIATIHGIEESGDVGALVMEFLEGPRAVTCPLGAPARLFVPELNDLKLSRGKARSKGARTMTVEFPSNGLPVATFECLFPSTIVEKNQ